MGHQILFPAIISLLFALIGTKGMMLVSILDEPEEERSSHGVPTPTSGGVVVILTTFLFLMLAQAPFKPVMAWILTGAVIIALIGFVDEFQEITVKLRLLIELTVGIIVIYMALTPSLTFLSLLYCFLLLILLGGFTNAFNFIDGLNGMSAGAGIVSAFFCGIFFPEQSIFYVALIPGLIGFLVFNARGKIFIGDVGSLFLGFVFPAFLLLTPAHLNASILILGHLFFPYLSDVSVTFIRRMKKGLSVVKPHRDFFFLRLHRAGISHLAVSGLYASLACLQGALLLAFPPHTVLDFLCMYLVDFLLYAFILYRMHRYAEKKLSI